MESRWLFVHFSPVCYSHGGNTAGTSLLGGGMEGEIFRHFRRGDDSRGGVEIEASYHIVQDVGANVSLEDRREPCGPFMTE